MNCCLFKKSTNARPSRVTRFPAPPTIEVVDISLQCGKCRAPQAVPEKAIVMVCSACRCVNRITVSQPSLERKVSFIDCDVGDVQLLHNTPLIFQLGESSDGNSIPICSVCLDGPGDMVLDNCGHGGICEACARHIALNKAVGGAHCPLDKQDISHILRIGELHTELVKARQIVLPDTPNKEPPRVPPPVGMRKGKAASTDSEPKKPEGSDGSTGEGI